MIKSAIDTSDEKILIQTYKRLLRNFLHNETSVNNHNIVRVLTYYDAMITKDNIRHFYNRHIKIFFVALVTNQLNKIQDNHPKAENIDLTQFGIL